MYHVRRYAADPYPVPAAQFDGTEAHARWFESKSPWRGNCRPGEVAGGYCDMIVGTHGGELVAREGDWLLLIEGPKPTLLSKGQFARTFPGGPQ